jgi:hypothetical protein
VVIKKKQWQRSVQIGAVQENPAVRSYGALFVSLGMLFNDDEFILKPIQDVHIILSSVCPEGPSQAKQERPCFARDKDLTEQTTTQNDEGGPCIFQNESFLERLNSRR